jgi:uncharacterized membrane protein
LGLELLALSVACPHTQVPDPAQAGLVAGAATVANFAESYLGASLQGREGWDWLTNDMVNMLQISLAAGIAVGGKLALLG